MEKQIYIAPELEVLEVQIEQGFAVSGGYTPDYGNGGHFGPTGW